MENYRKILIVGIIEILIGSITLFSTLISVYFSTNTKSPSVLAFVIIAASISTLIGIGILRLKKLACSLLLYFSSVIILSKILIIMEVIQLNGALVTAVPSPLNNVISIVYHGILLYYLSRPNIRQIFHR